MAVKSVALFGFYDPAYSRNRVWAAGFQALGIEVIHARVNPTEHRRFLKYWKLIQTGLKLKRRQPDLIILAFPGQILVPLAWWLFGRRFVFDAFLSLYETEVFDRQNVRPGDFRASWYFFVEWLAVQLAPKILLDTEAHIDYFLKTFGGRREKFLRIFVGTTPDLFYPQPNSQSNSTIVHFHGRGTPLHGLKVIEKAAAILAARGSAAKFRLVGVSKKEFPPNLEYWPPAPLTELNNYLAEAKIVLGVFGRTPKVNLVIPNKIYEGLAAGRLVITTDSPAARELLSDRETGLLVPAGDAVALAKAIDWSITNPVLAKQIGDNGYALFCRRLMPIQLARELLAFSTS